jgi:ATP-dependent Clp protease ATP-binding subunit ClpA
MKSMPKINVYLPDDLAEAVRDARIPVSSICQRALQQAVRFVTTVHQTVSGDLDPDELAERLPQFTARARDAVAVAIDAARATSAPGVSTGHLLTGVLSAGEGMAVDMLRAVTVDPALVLQALAAETATEPGGSGPRSFTAPAAAVVESALAESISLGHNYIGGEHLLLAMINEPDSIAGRALRELGAEARSVRRAMTTTLNKFASTAVVTQKQLTPLIARIEHLEQELIRLKENPGR